MNQILDVRVQSVTHGPHGSTAIVKLPDGRRYPAWTHGHWIGKGRLRVHGDFRLDHAGSQWLGVAGVERKISWLQWQRSRRAAVGPARFYALSAVRVVLWTVVGAWVAAASVMILAAALVLLLPLCALSVAGLMCGPSNSYRYVGGGVYRRY
ncbi:MAG: hypothetical protein QM621_08070 [Aeromicrobium sp.]|uniref:hypothetical protein n=1 Tax=Aeromicrobium sp. TaxID=1871063 RepID=UPI0039E5A4AB